MKLPVGKTLAVALAMLLVIALIGLVLAVLIPRKPHRGHGNRQAQARHLRPRSRHRDAGRGRHRRRPRAVRPGVWLIAYSIYLIPRDCLGSAVMARLG